eukprot:UN05781
MVKNAVGGADQGKDSRGNWQLGNETHGRHAMFAKLSPVTTAADLIVRLVS